MSQTPRASITLEVDDLFAICKLFCQVRFKMLYEKVVGTHEGAEQT